MEETGMPVVPKENINVQSVLPQGELVYQHVHARPEEFGQRMAHALELAGRNFEGEALGMIHETNVNDVFANQFDPAVRQIYRGSLGLDGKEAAQQLPQVEKAMTDLVSALGETLPNDYQRNLFNQMCRERINSDLAGLGRHAAACLDRWQLNTADAISDAAGRRIGDDIYNFDKVAGPNGLITGIKGMAEAQSALSGEERSVSDLRAAGSIDKGLSDGILNEARSNPIGARMLYDRYAQYMSSDAVRRHVLDNLLPAVRQEQSNAVYSDLMGRFDLTGRDSDKTELDAAVNHVMDSNNYGDQFTDADQRGDMAKMIQGTWNRARQFHLENQSSADSSFTDAVASDRIAGITLQTWKDPRTGLAPSDEIMRTAVEHLADPAGPVVSDSDAIAGLASDISNRGMSDRGPINRAYLQNLISGRDFRDLSALYDTYRDPVKSRGFDYARDAFFARYGDASGPDGLNREAMKLFPSYLMDLDGAVRDQDLKGSQVRDLANRMLDDVRNLIPSGRSISAAGGAAIETPETGSADSSSAPPAGGEGNEKGMTGEVVDGSGDFRV
jgi:hypothetical protein